MLIPSIGGSIGDVAAIGGGSTLGVDKYKTFAPEYSAVKGTYKTRLVLGLGSYNFDFYIPDDFLTLQFIGMIGIANKNFTDQSIDLESNYHGPGEDYQTHVESDTTSLYTGVDDQFFTLDAGSVFSNLSPGDQCGLDVSHAITVEVHYTLGLLIYS
jgi:hypothetical protein